MTEAAWDVILVEAFTRGVRQYDYCSELPYFTYKDSSEYEALLLGLRATRDAVLQLNGGTCYDQSSQQEEPCPESVQP
jgi:hypothetical protein